MTSIAELSGFHRTYLRGLAHELKPTVMVGKEGVSDAVVAQVERELLAHELIKVKLTKPPDKKSAALELATRTGAQLCGLIGHVVILYKPHPKEPKIKLPAR